MHKINRRVWIASICLVSLGIISFILNFIPGVSFNIGWPLLISALGAALILLANALSKLHGWAETLYIPGGLLLALGLIFTLNVLTGDWNAWAYAWLLVLVGIGVGLLLANRSRRWPGWVNLLGLGLLLGGTTLAVLFGAIAGGLFIRIAAPILLVAGGLALRWVKPEMLLGRGAIEAQAVQHGAAAAPPDQSGLVEPLSARELEVLRLIAEGRTNAQIAAALTLAQSTVKTHINNIYGKLGVQTRLAAVQRAKAQGLLPD